MLVQLPKFKVLDMPEPASPPGLLRRIVYRVGAHLTGVHGIDDVMEYVVQQKKDEAGTCPHQDCLDFIGIDWEIPESDLEHVPREGPLLIASNHAYGGADGLILCTAFKKIRPDFSIMTNKMLFVLPVIRDDYLPLDAFDNNSNTNSQTLRTAMSRLKDGRAVATFPAGEVSHRTWENRSVTDPEWMQSIALMAKRTKATVLPLYFHGHNSEFFQIAGLIHPTLRTMMLARQLLNKKGKKIHVSIGRPISPEQIAAFDDRETLTQYLRGRVYMLADRRRPEPKTHKPLPSHQPLLPEITTADRCADEVMALSEKQRLVDSGNLTVYLARGKQIPNILREIGRLRELTFRAVGEGSGNELDLDRFDRAYRHLFIWNHEEQEIVGAYRLGLTDEIMRMGGVRGLYTWTLFDFDERFLKELGPAVELGRSFIRPEYQRSFKPLMLLWRGISRFICLKPKYRYFFGVVSISNEYAAASQRLMTDFVSSTRMVDDFQSLIAPRTPHQPKHVRHWDMAPFRLACTELSDVEELVRDIENDRQGVPILLKQYLKLNAKLITFFNVDPEFSDVIDGMMLVDFLDVDRRIQNWYFGKDEAAAFRRHHGLEDDEVSPDSSERDADDLTASA
ncbi:MAG: lysophospholipid acyltransferase family protein [Phycisphaerales bacterium]|nr:lysophospholipid acyltransferase family protein [Phycisphaerales bacterium]